MVSKMMLHSLIQFLVFFAFATGAQAQTLTFEKTAEQAQTRTFETTVGGRHNSPPEPKAMPLNRK
jgi:hypothetical protein